MNNFHKSLIRLLFATAFLLLVAWVSLKLMTGEMDLDGLIRQGEKLARGLGRHLKKLDEGVLQPARRFIEPRVNDLVRRVGDLVRRFNK